MSIAVRVPGAFLDALAARVRAEMLPDLDALEQLVETRATPDDVVCGDAALTIGGILS